jgi:hypothetical protein
MRREHLPEPWHSFFRDVDRAFDHPVALLRCDNQQQILGLHLLARRH